MTYEQYDSKLSSLENKLNSAKTRSQKQKIMLSIKVLETKAQNEGLS